MSWARSRSWNHLVRGDAPPARRPHPPAPPSASGLAYSSRLQAPRLGPHLDLVAVEDALQGSDVWLAGYVIACAIWPFRVCRRCDGSGKRRSPSGRAWRKCRRCKGVGARLRFGRHAYNYLHATKEGAKS